MQAQLGCVIQVTDPPDGADANIDVSMLPFMARSLGDIFAAAPSQERGTCPEILRACIALKLSPSTVSHILLRAGFLHQQRDYLTAKYYQSPVQDSGATVLDRVAAEHALSSPGVIVEHVAAKERT